MKVSFHSQQKINAQKAEISSPLTVSTADSPFKTPPVNAARRKLMVTTQSSFNKFATQSSTSFFFPPNSNEDRIEEQLGNLSKEMNTSKNITISSQQGRDGKLPPQHESRRSQMHVRINKTLGIKDFSETLQSDVRSPIEIERAATTAHSKKNSNVPLEGLKSPNPHFAKFSAYFQALNQSEVRKSHLTKDLFYYPDQVELNKKFQEERKEIKILEESALYQIKTIKEGRKEKIDLPLGSKCYLKISCVGKNFPLRVRLELKLGTFEIYVSKSNDKPDKRNCDFFYTSSSFQVHYANSEDIQFLYFGITGSGNLTMNITMHFATIQQKQVLKLPKRPVTSKKPTANPGRYEFFRPNMTWEEEKEFLDIIADIKRERAARNGKDIITSNSQIAAEYQIIQKQKQLELVKDYWEISKREMTSQKNREKRDTILYNRKMQQICALVKSDVKKLEVSWKTKEEQKAVKLNSLRKDWLIITTIALLGRSIVEKKRTIVALKIIQNMKEMNAIKIQRKFRAYLARNHPKVTMESENSETEQLELMEVVKLTTMHKALRMVAQMGVTLQMQKAEKLIAKMFGEMLLPVKVCDSLDKYIDKLVVIQKKWRRKMKIVQARVQLFMVSWDKFSSALYMESKNKKKTMEVFSKIKPAHLMRHAKRFVFNRMLMPSSTFAQAAQIFIRQPSQTLSPDCSPSSNKKIKAAVGGAKDLRKAESIILVKNVAPQESKIDSINALQAKTKFKPNKDELKDIYDHIVKELQNDGEL